MEKWLSLNSEKMAVGYLIEGEIRLKTARLALSEGHFAYAIRQSQECVESRELRREREPSMYGESDLNMPPDELYTKFDAQQAVDKAENVHSSCKKLLENKI